MKHLKQQPVVISTCSQWETRYYKVQMEWTTHGKNICGGHTTNQSNPIGV